MLKHIGIIKETDHQRKIEFTKDVKFLNTNFLTCENSKELSECFVHDPLIKFIHKMSEHVFTNSSLSAYIPSRVKAHTQLS